MFDTIKDIGTQKSENLELKQGPDFPVNPKIGLLFMHETHGIVVYCHDGNWRKVQAQYESTGG